MNPVYEPGKNGVRIGRYAAFGLAALTIITFGFAMMAIHYITPTDEWIFSTISIAFAHMSALILLADYYVQFSVVPISFMKGEKEGIPLISQYNGHGIFIALEELGYWLMALIIVGILPEIFFLRLSKQPPQGSI